MSVKSAIRMVLAKRGMSQVELSRLWNGSPQAISNKFSRNTWTAADLVKIARLTDCQLMFVFPDGQQVLIAEDDPPTKKDKPPAKKAIRPPRPKSPRIYYTRSSISNPR